ncbi:hypothetical protein MRB53_030919 [Persea americana]|uniref:Uncharacterized protein n=1 Tax=Persea americana TaxID=3435 RepID=A0ACC2KN02_PERAE|nr:hypothetical protein MRB53_030919 [Persea americana]
MQSTRFWGKQYTQKGNETPSAEHPRCAQMGRPTTPPSFIGRFSFLFQSKIPSALQPPSSFIGGCIGELEKDKMRGKSV